jgi:hypothetical protein
MSFLDNSGDIVLDAVLTEVGRKKLANGQFRIRKFALGDDEIGYNLYDKNNASGSAYYDLEILQTPILEGFTNVNAGINYGLLSYPNPRLLYLPVIKENHLHPVNGVEPYNKIYYLAVNGETYTALQTAFGGGATGASKILFAGKLTSNCILLETGLDTAEVAGTTTNKSNYLSSQGLVDSTFAVSIDRRFVSAVLCTGPSAVFNNGAGMGASNISLTPLIRRTPRRADSSLSHHNMAFAPAVANNVYYRTGDTTIDTATSVIAGPRASMVGLSFDVKPITSTDFSRFGQTSLSIGGNAYSAIDTSVIVSGMTTGVMLEVPVRIIKKN